MKPLFGADLIEGLVKEYLEIELPPLIVRKKLGNGSWAFASIEIEIHETRTGNTYRCLVRYGHQQEPYSSDDRATHSKMTDDDTAIEVCVQGLASSAQNVFVAGIVSQYIGLLFDTAD